LYNFSFSIPPFSDFFGAIKSRKTEGGERQPGCMGEQDAKRPTTRIELKVPDKEYGILVESDKGD
jgi:hypothetical protein